MTDLMRAYQGQLNRMGLEGLGIRPLPNPLAGVNGKYVGSEACQTCHEQSYRVWKKTPHSHAFVMLHNAKPPRNFDPECISCHTVGCNTQKFFPYESGYLSHKHTPHLMNVGCEDCHGPGEKHVAAGEQRHPGRTQLAAKTVGSPRRRRPTRTLPSRIALPATTWTTAPSSSSISTSRL